MHSYVSIQLDDKSRQPLYRQLHGQLKHLILEQVVAPHEKLPPIRRMAALLKINPGTVAQAYRLLEQENLVYSRTGSGTFAGSPETPGITPLLRKADPEFDISGLDMMDRGQLEVAGDAINLASVTPTPELFPIDDFKAILNEVLDRDGGNAFGYQESQGFYPLRESVAIYLGLNGIKTHPDEIQVISGAQQGIDILAKSLLKFGDPILTESPTYTGAIAAFKSRGAQIIPVSMDHDGINLEELRQKIDLYQPRFLYIMPVFQNPTGTCYSEKKKSAVLDLCREKNLLVIEDDSFTELVYDNKPRYPIKTMDTDHQVVYIKSFSKIFMPGMRVAFLLAPPGIIPRLVAAKHTSDISTSGLMQRAFDLYLRKDLWRKQITAMRTLYQRRYDNMLKSLKKHLPAEIHYHRPGGGLMLWLQLPRECSSTRLYELCLAQRVIITPGGLFYPDNRESPSFRLSFAAVHSGDMEEGIRQVARCCEQILSRPKRNEVSPLL